MRALVCVRDVCCVAFPLVMLSGLEFSLVLRFRAFVRVFIWVRAGSPLQAVLKGLSVARWL